MAAYRSAIIRPSERSLRGRRLMHDVISSWSAGGYYARSELGPGLRKSWRDLNRALQVRVRREFGRFGFNTSKPLRLNHYRNRWDRFAPPALAFACGFDEEIWQTNSEGLKEVAQAYRYAAVSPTPARFPMPNLSGFARRPD